MTHAIRIHDTGGPEVLRWEQVDVGDPGPGEARVRHTAVGLNYIDTYQRSGLYKLPLPSGLGSEAAGVVEAVGAGVTDLRAGDRVAYCTGPLGAYSEARVMPAERLVKLPDAITDEQGALMMLKGLTTQYLLHQTYEVKAGDTIRLDRGDMYVDIPPGSRAPRSFVAITSAGEFRHLGTQFALSVSEGGTRLRVREGSVQWHSDQGESTVDAGTEVLIDRNRNVTRQDLDTAGEQWAWTEVMTPDIDIEDRPLSEFLDWVARETGRRLEFADDATRQQAANIRMHGNVHGLAPLAALKAVMASTSLRLDLPAGVIRVSLAGDSIARR